ncbi:MAG: hypothetical protein RR804_07560, partial [Massilia sp.]
FAVNGEGQLVTEDGYAVEPAITIPQDAIDVSISKSGQVQVTTQGQTAPQVVGQLELATFFNEAGLEAIGDNLLLETAASGAATIGGGTLRIKFQDGVKPAVGDTLTVISAASLKGKFETITVDGFTVTPTYTDTGLQLRLGS